MADDDFDHGWIDAFADGLGVERLKPEQADALLARAGEAAHGSGDRRNAPLSCYLIGLAGGLDAGSDG